MRAASGLSSGQQATPELAAEAVRMALAAGGLERADQVILFLSRDFVRQAQPAVLAAARVAGCLAVSGCTANGVFTELGWQIDRPAAAAMVLSKRQQSTATDCAPRLCFSQRAGLPHNWQNGHPRVGLLDAQGASWVHARPGDDQGIEANLSGFRGRIAISTGLRCLGDAQTIEQCRGYELQQIGGYKAVDSLIRLLPAELRLQPPWHQIMLQRRPDEPGISILSANADGSMALSAPVATGEQIYWSIRQPLSAEQNMRQALNAAVNPKKAPDLALMFSCIGRGPLFYGSDDRDLQAFREQFPETPLLGAYGYGQIAPITGGNAVFQNSVITLLLE